MISAFEPLISLLNKNVITEVKNNEFSSFVDIEVENGLIEPSSWTKACLLSGDRIRNYEEIRKNQLKSNPLASNFIAICHYLSESLKENFNKVLNEYSSIAEDNNKLKIAPKDGKTAKQSSSVLKASIFITYMAIAGAIMLEMSSGWVFYAYNYVFVIIGGYIFTAIVLKLFESPSSNKKTSLSKEEESFKTKHSLSTKQLNYISTLVSHLNKYAPPPPIFDYFPNQCIELNKKIKFLEDHNHQLNLLNTTVQSELNQHLDKDSTLAEENVKFKRQLLEVTRQLAASKSIIKENKLNYLKEISILKQASSTEYQRGLNEANEAAELNISQLKEQLENVTIASQEPETTENILPKHDVILFDNTEQYKNIIYSNPYRVIGLVANASQREFSRHNSRTLKMLRINKPISSNFDLTIFPPLQRNISALECTISQMENNQHQLINSLFWFVTNTETDKIALEYLQNSNPSLAYQTWENSISGDVLTLENSSHFLNLSTLKMLSDKENDIQEAIKMKLNIITASSFDEFVTTIVGSTYSPSVSEIHNLFIDSIIEPYSTNLSVKEILSLFSECKTTAKSYLSKQLANLSIKAIESKVNAGKHFKDKEPNEVLEAGKSLLAYSRNQLTNLEQVVNIDDIQYQIIVDTLCEEVAEFASLYFNNTSADEDESVSLLQEALWFNPSIRVKAQIKNNIDKYENWMKDNL